MVNITLREAKRRTEKLGIKVTLPTLTKWIKDNKLGRQPGGEGGKWFVHEKKFMKFIEGERLNAPKKTE